MAHTDPSDDSATNSIVSAIRQVVAVVALVTGAVVSLNTFITTHAAQKITDYSDFRKAVQVEETYWTSLYTSYESTFGGDFKSDDKRRDARLFVVSQLTEHLVPDFAEYKVPPALRVQAQKELETYRAGLRQVLANKDTSSPAVVQDVQAQRQAVADATVQRPADGALAASQDAAPVTPLAPTATPNLDTVVLTAGRAKGWDVDVFWCQGAGADAVNYVTAAQAASTLAEKAKLGAPIDRAGAVNLGRIRLRPLPAAINARPGYGSAAAEIRYEDGFNERPAADAVIALVNASQGIRFSLHPTGSRTPWYVSLFACAPAKPATSPEGRAASSPAP